MVSSYWIPNVVIDFLNGRPGLEVLGDRLTEAECFASVITRMELLSFERLTAESEKLVRDFLANLTVASLDDKIEHAAIALRRATRLKLPDAIVAATAWAGGLVLLTSDQQMLNMEWPGLEIRSPLLVS
jgi:predicted nucleic acid-binding protein